MFCIVKVMQDKTRLLVLTGVYGNPDGKLGDKEEGSSNPARIKSGSSRRKRRRRLRKGKFSSRLRMSVRISVTKVPESSTRRVLLKP